MNTGREYPHHTIPLANPRGKLNKIFICLAIAIASIGHIKAATTTLADQPIFSSSAVPGNMMLDLSVEYPTANSTAYPTSLSPYVSATGFIGYFDPGKCYAYYYDNSVTLDNAANQSFFYPVGAADSNHQCVTSGSTKLWSGSFMNWATMQTIDPFRWALTGGYRSGDYTTAGTGATTGKGTMIEKAWASGDGGSGETPNRSIPSTITVNTLTPFSWTGFNFRIWGLGNRMQFTNTGSFDGSNQSTAGSAYDPAAASYSASTIYSVIARVRVCDATVSLESNCKQYTGTDGLPLYKPEGLMQQYATKIRYGAFGYLNDGNIKRDGAALRANIKFIGPQYPQPGTSTNINNANNEWDATTGIFVTNPNPTDATATATAIGGGASITNSGVMNYLNKFGETSHKYKSYDPVSELYYASIRYFKNQGQVVSYSNNLTSTFADGFPVITSWTDPIQYSCQKNFILGIGDVNTHADANLPGSTLVSSNEPSTPSEVSSDTTVNVTTATNAVGNMEGVNNLGGTYVPWCCGDGDTYYIAGLAYDSHVKDMRPNDFKNSDGSKTFIQTVSTYWLDVEEYQTYKYKNQYWYAAKYGGFKVPANYVPYPSTAVPLTQSSWNASGGVDVNGNPQPDNYFGAGQASNMVAGLKTAFSNIVSQITEDTTAFSTSKPQVSADPSNPSLAFSGAYDTSNWSGNMVANTITFDSSGNPTLTSLWSARDILNTQVSGTGWDTARFIATYSSGHGVPFRQNKLASSDATALDPATILGTPNNVASTTTQTNYINYLRGDQTNETNSIATGSTHAYRTRAYIMADIVGSKIHPIDAPNAPYSESTNAGYTAFKSTNSSRKTVVYFGANDGMLHAIDGTASASSGGGKELFAYVPGGMYQSASGASQGAATAELAQFGNPTFTHYFYVNATPNITDLDMGNAGGHTGSSSWASLLVGGLGKGGKSYYALDVTTPSNLSNETNLAAAVKWEFTDSSMGYSFGDPIVAKTKKYGWVVILTSGYNTPDGKGYLYIVDPTTGTLLQKIPATDSGNSSIVSNGLTYASAYTTDLTDSTVESVYAGDLNGNVWRFDLTTTGTSYPVTRIAYLTDASGNPQPITTTPIVQIQPTTFRRYVLVGTGKLLASADMTNSQAQAFYAIVDGIQGAPYTAATLPTGVTFPITRSELNANTNLVNGIGTAPTSVMGWYFDLAVSSSNVAEQINVTPAVNLNSVLFAANLTNGDACNPTGTSRIFEVDFATGKSVLIDSSNNVIANYTNSSIVVDVDIIKVGTSSTEGIVGNMNSKTFKPPEKPPTSAGTTKTNWREIPTTN
ncbi:pilus assembly protein [Andreprevotia chitinilytica]|uniref:pilus assembly protein n=1 Tax=Andreprevotia chitinilytica TaxID=396808 RepID=UPI0009FE7932|nr:PilC/PilY family type IV pilus protein [Andreprevotia chitinilytica]